MVDWTANSVSILLGNGDGTFKAHVDYPVGGHPHAIVAADFNGDGTLDLATANWLDGTVSVLSGHGDGTFGTAATYTVGTSPARLAVADFNGDGIPDLAVVNHLNASAGVLLGVGDGTFMAMQSLATPANPHAIVAGDFNGDGIPDLAVACNSASGTTVGLFLNSTMTPMATAYSHLSDGIWYFHVCAIDTSGAAGPTATRGGNRHDGPRHHRRRQSRRRAHLARRPLDSDAHPHGPAGRRRQPLRHDRRPLDPVLPDGGATWQTGTTVAFPRWKRGGGSGTFSVLYRSTDAAGNPRRPSRPRCASTTRCPRRSPP